MSKYENRFQAVPQKTECQKFLETNYTCLVERGVERPFYASVTNTFGIESSLQTGLEMYVN